MTKATPLAERIEKFCNAYYTGDCLTFVDPANGKLVSANDEVRAFAGALMAGPLADEADAEKNRDHLFEEMREALRKLERWSTPFIEKNSPISAETLWREFPKAIENARTILIKIEEAS